MQQPNDKKLIKISIITSLYNCEEYLKDFLLHVASVSNIDEIELLLLHNEPKESELAILNALKYKFGNRLKHHIVSQREVLYASWNRGIRAATGKYIAIWNVDDVRVPDSLARQAKILDENNAVYFTYGGQVEVVNYGDRNGVLVEVPDFATHPASFLNNYLCGCFPMWKKEVHDRIGYFDEQFKSAGDFDFCIRLARAYAGKKAEGNHGYYLASTGISKTGKINNIERTVVEIRYGQFHKINFIFVFMALSGYSIKKVRWENTTYRIDAFFKEYHKYVVLRIPCLVIGVLLFPFRFLLPTMMKYIKIGLTHA